MPPTVAYAHFTLPQSVDETSCQAGTMEQSVYAREIEHLVRVIAPTASTVLIKGETGTGKDVTAQHIHKQSTRKGKFISVNCAAIPAALLESELFGHEKGAFTGAEIRHKGRFEQAENGTLFLDEIGDMSPELQAKLLRAIETRTIQRVGGCEDIAVNFRLICATHRNLEHYVKTGKFREDLFYRINVFPIELPTLAQRYVDIPNLSAAILQKIAEQQNITPPYFSDEALTVLMQHNWPGNIRELRNILERATIVFSGQTITARQVKENLLRLRIPESAKLQPLSTSAKESAPRTKPYKIDSSFSLPRAEHYKSWFDYHTSIDIRCQLRDIEIVLIEAAIAKTKGNVSHAAEILNLRRTTLIEKMRKLMISKPTT